MVISHWLLDLIAHRPDLPLTFAGETKVGLGLWNNVTATMLLEAAIFFIGVALYTATTKAKNHTGKYALFSLVLFFILIYIMNAFGDLPPDAKSIAYVGLAQWLFILWGYWVDKNKTLKNDPKGSTIPI